MGIRLGGLATGIDTQALIEAILAVERRPLSLAQQKKSTLESEQGILRDLNTRLLSLRDAAGAIDNRTTGFSSYSFDEELISYTASSSDDTRLGASVTTAASPGSYDVSISQLATSAREISVGFATATDPVVSENETLNIEFGGDAPIGFVVGAGGASLNELRDTINGHANNDGSVRAEVLFDGTNHRLVVTGRDTGAENDLILSGTLTAPAMGPPFFDGLLAADAEDASFSVLGVAMTSPSNDVSTALPGVTFNLRGETAVDETIRIDVTRDETATGDRVQAFVDAFNSVRDLIREQTRYNAQTETAGPLQGDSTLRTVERELQTLLGDSYAVPGSSFSLLSEIGVRFQDDGSLALDRDALKAALDQDPNGVRLLLAGDPNATNPDPDGPDGIDGVAVALSRVLDGLTDPNDNVGVLAARDAGFDQRIAALDSQIDRMTVRLEQREELLVAQFSQMEALVSSLQAQGNSLSGLVTQGSS